VIIKTIDLLCDFCYEEFDFSLPRPVTASEARKRAKESTGWVYRRGGDICPTCQPQWG
jgi:hypothetical protein